MRWRVAHQCDTVPSRGIFILAGLLHRPGKVKPMKLFISLILWCILLVICWPLALIMLFLFPLVWLLLLPFAIVGLTLEVIFKLIAAVLVFPFRFLGARV